MFKVRLGLTIPLDLALASFRQGLVARVLPPRLSDRRAERGREPSMAEGPTPVTETPSVLG